MNKEQLQYNINAALFDSDEDAEKNCVRLDNRTAYGLNVINDLITRGNINSAKKALSELRVNGRLFDSKKYYGEIPVLLVTPETARDAYADSEVTL